MSKFPKDERDLTSEQMDELMTGGEPVELVAGPTRYGYFVEPSLNQGLPESSGLREISVGIPLMSVAPRDRQLASAE